MKTEGFIISEQLDRFGEGYITLEERRLLSDVIHLVDGLRSDGSVPSELEHDVKIDLYTGIQEIAMPSAVTVTIQEVEQEIDAEGRQMRVIKWLGRTATEWAASGYKYHFSEPALQRVPIEIAEAGFNQEFIRPGRVQAMVSPKMSRHDASTEIAKREHLYEDDSIRVSRPIVDSRGNVVARRLESLLVTDIPLEAWVDMFEDSKNIFNQSFKLANRSSALSIMELFDRLDVPEELLPEGPVTLVQAVLPYIRDTVAYDSVSRQLEKFRADQQLYQEQAEVAAEDWFAFDLELARSLKQGKATYEIERMIATLQHQWTSEDLEIIAAHDVAGSYAMTYKLAAMLENAQQKLLASEAAILTGNEKVLKQMDTDTAQMMADKLKFAQIIRRTDPMAYRALEVQNRRMLARQNFSIKGGCLGENTASFRDDRNDDPDQAKNGTENNSEASKWKWKKGVCRVEACKSPKPTEVGPCSVCRNCQHMFDRGDDPTKAVSQPRTPIQTLASKALSLTASSLFDKPPRQKDFALAS